MLERWKGTLDLSNRSVAKYLVILHGIFKRASKVWGLARNPVVDVERPRYRVSDDVNVFSPRRSGRSSAPPAPSRTQRCS
jgi:integrase